MNVSGPDNRLQHLAPSFLSSDVKSWLGLSQDGGIIVYMAGTCDAPIDGYWTDHHTRELGELDPGEQW